MSTSTYEFIIDGEVFATYTEEFGDPVLSFDSQYDLSKVEATAFAAWLADMTGGVA